MMLLAIADMSAPTVFPPVPESVSALHALLAVGCVILGVALLLRGLKLSRCLMAIVGAAAGAAGAVAWQQAMPDLNPLMIYGGCIGAGIVLGALMARFLIGLLAGVTLGTVSMLWVVHTNAAKLSESSSPERVSEGAGSLALWATAIYQDGWNYMRVALEQREFAAIGLVVLAFLVPLILSLLLRRIATMVVSAVIGAAMILGGGMLLVGFGGLTEDLSEWMYSLGMLIALGALTLAGLIFQIITLFRKPTAVPDEDASDE
jgi:hypothetical protein